MSEPDWADELAMRICKENDEAAAAIRSLKKEQP